MIILICAILGVVTGVTIARRRGGKGADMAQYAAGYAIAFMIVGLFLSILIERLAG